MTPTTRRRLQTAANDVVAGNDVGVGGAGFAPNATITLLWADGAGQRTTVLTDNSGNFLISMHVAGNERPGDRLLVAQTPGTGSDPASVVLRVISRPSTSRRRLPRVARRLIARFDDVQPLSSVGAETVRIGPSDAHDAWSVV